MAAARLKALLHATKGAQHSAQQRNTLLLHVAPPKECNTQHVPEADYTGADLARMDDLLRQLAELEGWPAELLTARLDERRRMAPVNVLPTLKELQAAVTAALAVWPEQPAKTASITLCRLVH